MLATLPRPPPQKLAGGLATLPTVGRTWQRGRLDPLLAAQRFTAAIRHSVATASA